MKEEEEEEVTSDDDTTTDTDEPTTPVLVKSPGDLEEEMKCLVDDLTEAPLPFAPHTTMQQVIDKEIQNVDGGATFSLSKVTFYCCPWPDCPMEFMIADSEIHCGIFRCGVMRGSGDQIAVHATKEQCQRMLAEEMVYGCARPFTITKDPESGVFQIATRDVYD